MSNEEKANEICKRHIFDSNHFDCCMEMAQWKDEQWRTMLHTVFRAWQAGKTFKEFEQFLHNFENEQPATT